jgi:signal recognition particle subunit SRP54
MTVTDVNQLVQRFEQAAKMMKTVARGGVPNIPAWVRWAASPARQQARQAEVAGGLTIGNPAKRAAENAGSPPPPGAPTGSGFGLGAAATPPSEADLAEIQKLFGKN